MKLCSLETIPPLTVAQIKVNLVTEAGCSPKLKSLCIINNAIPDSTVLTRGPALVQPDEPVQAFLHIANSSPNPIILQRGEFMGFIKNKLVVPSDAWDFFFDKHINLTYRDGVVF
jgi:hypothetical protein